MAGQAVVMPVSATPKTRPGFDVARPGTADEAWLRLLAGQPSWEPEGSPLIVVAPHPDDETLGAGGLIASYARRNRPVLVVSVTDGEAAHPGWQGLRSIRRSELRRALNTLSPHLILQARVGLADGEVHRHERVLRDYLLHLVPRGAVLVAPYECDGHTDHEAVGRVCQQVAAARGVVCARYPIWAWHQARVESLRDARWGRFELRGEWREAKARAIRAFVSQLRPRLRKPVVPAHVLAYFARPYEAFLL
jgi:LmbE family N-acetylglucosaminyl deacetylase